MYMILNAPIPFDQYQTIQILLPTLVNEPRNNHFYADF